MVRLRRPFFPPVVLLAVLVVSMGLAGCESSGVSRTVQIGERPTWNAGDSWTYRGRGPSGTFNVTRKVLREGVFEGREAYEVDAGGTHGRPVLAHVIDRLQPAMGTTVRRAGRSRCALT